VQRAADHHERDRRPAERTRVGDERDDEHRQVQQRPGDGAQPHERGAADGRLGHEVPPCVCERRGEDEREDGE
jgi:hypothetical protein